MGLLTHALLQSCKRIIATTDKFGDQVPASVEVLPCRFRFVSEVTQSSNREETNATAILWLEPTVSISEGELIEFESRFYTCDKIVDARRLKGNTIEFKKCYLQRHGDIELPESS